MFALLGRLHPPRSRVSPSGLAALVLVGIVLTAPGTHAVRPSATEPRAAIAPAEVRALWVTRVSLTTPRSIASVVQSARASGFNTLLVQVRGRGDAYFASAVEPRADSLAGQPADFDPLATLIAQARAEGLRVHAWVNVNLVASATELPASRTHLVYRHPEWLMMPRPLAYELARIDARSPEYLGRLARWTRAADDVEGLFVSPIHAAAADHLVSVVDDLARRYPLDGVHLDYVRYPGSQFDYSRAALQAFRQDLDAAMSDEERRRFDPASMTALLAATDTYSDRWAGFRRSRLNALVLRLRTAVRSRLPEALFSAAVYPDPVEATAHRFQDWPMWLEHGWIDVVCPMAYTPDAAVFAAQIASVRQAAGDRPVWAGIGAYRLSPAQTIENIQTARRLGANGIVLFSYDSLVHLPHGLDYLGSVGRAAFTP
jgi:uncharacterized lipoprotein YddW (UPF0748 family)